MSTPYFTDDTVTLHHGDSLEVLRTLPDQSVDCCVTSPPYFGLRDYGTEGQYGLEASPAEYVETMRALFSEVRRVLANDSTLWLNLGDSYARNPAKGTSGTMNGRNVPRMGYAGDRIGRPLLPEKNLLGIPWRVAFALQDDGWILRNDIIWAKPNGMPESVTDRLTTKHEHLFMFSKSPRYWFDVDPIREARSDATTARYAYAFKADEHAKQGTGLRGGFMEKANELGKNPGDVWTLATQPFSEAHFAVMPPELARRAVVAGCKPGGVVLDPFSGSGTTGLVAGQNGRRYVGIDLSRDYLDLSLRTRLAQTALIDTTADTKEAS